MASQSSQALEETPWWILRHHSPASVTAVAFVQESADCQEEEENSSSDDSQDVSRESSHAAGDAILIAGDANGVVSVTSLQDRRPWMQWQAHKEGQSVLGVQAFTKHRLLSVVTHGRDNEIHVWQICPTQRSMRGVRPYPGSDDDVQTPHCLVNLPVNALNFCRFSLLQHSAARDDTVLLAVPHSLDSGLVDVFALDLSKVSATETQFTRLYTAVGKEQLSGGSISPKIGGVKRAPIVMSMHLIRIDAESLAIVAAYEDGFVRMWEQGQPWRLRWEKKAHRESALSTALYPLQRTSPASSAARYLLVTVGADDRIALLDFATGPGDGPRLSLAPTNKQGRSSVAFLQGSEDDDDDVDTVPSFVVGGWDGRVRVYSVGELSDGQDETKVTPFNRSVECVSVLRYHKESIQSVAAAKLRGVDIIAVGGKEGRISLWSTAVSQSLAEHKR